MVRNLSDVVRCWRSRTAQPIGCIRKHIGQSLSGLAIEGLEDAGLIKHYALKVARVKVCDHLVVCDCNLSGRPRAITDIDDLRSELRTFTNGLSCHTQGSNDKHISWDGLRPL